MSGPAGEPQELDLVTPDLRLAAQAWGQPDAAPVLALHGWLDNAASFAPLAPLLPGIRLIALDLPGHGRSQHRPPGALYHFVDFIADVVAAADALGWERFALLGHSLGAAIASFVAAVVPERVRRLALIEGLGPLTTAPADTAAQLARSLRERQRLRDKRLPVYAGVEEAARARAAAGQGVTFAAAMVLAARGTRRAPSGVTWRSDPRLTVPSPAYLSEEQVQAVLRCIEAPTLLIRADGGTLHARRTLEERCRRVARLEMVDVPGGHHLHMEAPADVARVLGPRLAEP